MNLSNILRKESIVPDLVSTTKHGIIQELSRALATAANAPAQDIAAVLMEREALGSTGIGGGIAIPHGKLTAVTDVILGFGRSLAGVEYDSLDSRPVHIFFLLLTPENSSGSHLKVLAQISKLLKMEHFKQGLKTADTLDDIYDIILEQDEDF
ncbi:MAG: PTS sugar transporter subunit IIA [Desulfotignum sp.]|nr:PTS sugar transporter subunit IIA [Desulfobacteraceae bacterium]